MSQKLHQMHGNGKNSSEIHSPVLINDFLYITRGHTIPDGFVVVVSCPIGLVLEVSLCGERQLFVVLRFDRFISISQEGGQYTGY